MFSFKNILFYIGLFIVTIFANKLYYMATGEGPIDELSGDFTDLGISESVPILVYSASWCNACNELKDYLSNNNIQYNNIDIDEDKSAMKRLGEVGLTGIPVIIIKDNLIQGFNQKLLDKYLVVETNNTLTNTAN
jgi:glutaredoxin